MNLLIKMINPPVNTIIKSKEYTFNFKMEKRKYFATILQNRKRGNCSECTIYIRHINNNIFTKDSK